MYAPLSLRRAHHRGDKKDVAADVLAEPGTSLRAEASFFKRI